MEEIVINNLLEEVITVRSATGTTKSAIELMDELSQQLEEKAENLKILKEALTDFEGNSYGVNLGGRILWSKTTIHKLVWREYEDNKCNEYISIDSYFDESDEDSCTEENLNSVNFYLDCVTSVDYDSRNAVLTVELETGEYIEMTEFID